MHVPEARRDQCERVRAGVEQERGLVGGQGGVRRGAGGVGVSPAPRDRGGDQGLRGEEKKKRSEREDEDEKKKKGEEKKLTLPALARFSQTIKKNQNRLTAP